MKGSRSLDSFGFVYIASCRPTAPYRIAGALAPVLLYLSRSTLKSRCADISPARYNVGHVAIGIGDLGLAYQVKNEGPQHEERSTAWFNWQRPNRNNDRR